MDSDIIISRPPGCRELPLSISLTLFSSTLLCTAVTYHVYLRSVVTLVITLLSKTSLLVLYAILKCEQERTWKKVFLFLIVFPNWCRDQKWGIYRN